MTRPDDNASANVLRQLLDEVPPNAIAELTGDRQEHLARLVRGAVDVESAELVTAALARLERVPRSLRRPLMKFLKL